MGSLVLFVCLGLVGEALSLPSSPSSSRPRRLRAAGTHRKPYMALAYDRAAIDGKYTAYAGHATTPRHAGAGTDTRPISATQTMTAADPHAVLSLSGATDAPLVARAAGVKVCPCTRMWKPVRCPDGKTYANNCHSACARQQGCTSAGRTDPQAWLGGIDARRSTPPVDAGELMKMHAHDMYYHPLRKTGWQHHQHGLVANANHHGLPAQGYVPPTASAPTP